VQEQEQELQREQERLLQEQATSQEEDPEDWQKKVAELLVENDIDYKQLDAEMQPISAIAEKYQRPWTNHILKLENQDEEEQPKEEEKKVRSSKKSPRK